MRRRSLTGPLMLLIVGGLFLWHNLHPEAPLFELASQYWPFILIGWGLLRLVEVVFSHDEGWRGSFTGGEIVLVVLLCFAGMAVFQAHRYGIRFNTRRPAMVRRAVRLSGFGECSGGGDEAHCL